MTTSLPQYRELRLILGDQLNPKHSWFKTRDESTLYLIAELRQETDYVKHHVQKVCAFFAAMQNFAHALQQAGHEVLYLTLDDTQAYPDLPTLLQALLTRFKCQAFAYQQPDEYRVAEQLLDFATILKKRANPVRVERYDSEHFLLPFDDIPRYFSANKHHTMEYFYRAMRRRYGILMAEGKPVGGQWNFDKENRQALRKDDLAAIPAPLCFANDVKEILARLARHQISTFGESQSKLLWPTNKKQALQLLSHFCQTCLPFFGQFQDAMSCQTEHSWSLYHCRLSFALNSKMLHPLDVITSAIDAYQAAPERISLPQIEGFIRQILGWREFVRGIYWCNMPKYESLNSLHATRPLPDYFWHGETQMQCMQQAIKQSLRFGYAHHIQRLMVTGNFCLLTGIAPDDVDAWYLGIYVDALQWVELPNTRGMSQFADGGIIATKPYVASGNYLNKMSDYCQHCHYNVKNKVGPDACPFNSLYWHFLQRHEALFSNNPRMTILYRQWYRQDEATRHAILTQAEQYLLTLNAL